jgi:hypothetical protein
MKNFSDIKLPEFAPGAKYIAPMDCLIYLREDCSYRAIRLDPLRTVLLHPTEDRPVGIKVKGARFVAERVKAILQSAGHKFDQLTLASLWETACSIDGDEWVENADADRRRQYAMRAKKMLETAGQLDQAELQLAA